MILVYSAFDTSKLPADILATALLDDQTGSVNILPVFARGTGITLSEAYENKKLIGDLIRTADGLYINHLKLHLEATQARLDLDGKLYDFPDMLDTQYSDIEKVKETVIDGLALMYDEVRDRPEWRLISGRAAVAYEQMQRNGISSYGRARDVYWRMDTITGRSRCLGFPLQSYTGEDLRLKSVDNAAFVHLDWTAADFRVISIMSEDPELNESFQKSDPYSYVAELVGISRNEAKAMMLKTVYAVNIDSPIVDLFPKFGEWFKSSLSDLLNNGYIKSIMGRKFVLNDERNIRSVFNAHIQGSVTHALHSVLHKLYKIIPRYLMAELHDSVVIACDKDIAIDVAKAAANIMRHPLDNIIFPLRISIGDGWRNWKDLENEELV